MNVILKKILLLVVLLIFIINFLVAHDPNPKLLVKYSADEILQLKKDSPEQFELLNYFVESGYYFMEMPKKEIEFETLKKIDSQTGQVVDGYVITEEDLSNFNPLNYNCNFRDLKRSYYKVGETGMLLVIPATHELQIALDNQKRKNKRK